MSRSAFIQPYSAALRIWHWLTFFVTLFLIMTVLSAEFVFDKEEGAVELQQHFSNAGVSASSGQMQTVAESFTEKIWDVHTYLGYALAALFLFRIILEFFQPRDQKFFQRLHDVRRSDLYMKNRFILTKYIYMAFYILLTVIAVTGLIMAFNRGPLLEKEFEDVKEVHEISYYLLLVFLLLHLGGVLIAEMKHSKGIVSDMINGGSREND